MKVTKHFVRHVNQDIRAHLAIDQNAYLQRHDFRTVGSFDPFSLRITSVKCEHGPASTHYYAHALCSGKWIEFDPLRDRITFS